MSFGPEAAGRHAASAESPVARAARRLLLAGGCAVAGWIGASVLGGVAHAATPNDATPVASVLNSVGGSTDQITAITQAGHGRHVADGSGLAKINDSIRGALATVPGGSQHGSTITVRHADSTHPTAPRPDATPRHSDPQAVDHMLDSTPLGHDVAKHLQPLAPAVKPVTDPVTNPVTDKVIKPITNKVAPVADKVVKPVVSPVADNVTSTVISPVSAAAQRTATSLTAPVQRSIPTGLSAPLGGAIATLTNPAQDLTLPGLTGGSDSAGQGLAPIALGTVSGNPASHSLPVIRALQSSATRLSVPAVAEHGTARHAVTAQRSAHTVTTTAAARMRSTVAGNAQGTLDPVAGQRSPMARSIAPRAPATPAVPTAPQVPLGSAAGSTPSSTNNSGPSGGNSPAALDADADAPFRALGTVDPTDASMARSVAKRPCTSPD